MRTITIDNQTLGITGTIVVPDYTVFVFNPNYVELDLGGYTGSLTLSVNSGVKTYGVTVNLYQGKAKCYVSRLLQILFDDYISTRSKLVSIEIKDAQNEAIMSETFMAFWASIEPGRKFGYYHPFVYDRNKYPKYIREVIWFKNFPFRLSVYRIAQFSPAYAQCDGGAAKMIYEDGEFVWTVSSRTPRRRAPSATSLVLPASQTLDLNQLREAGLAVDFERSGITNISELNSITLEDVVLRDIYTGGETQIDWDDYAGRGLDIVTYNNLSNFKTGITELSPIYMFPNAQRKVVFTFMHKSADTAKFNANFNITFGEMTELAYIVKLTVCEDTDGIYLRWIDNYGFWQYFLFVAGERESKHKQSKVSVPAEFEENGVHHSATRCNYVENVDTVKCCAVNLRKEILSYVQTIYNSPHVEMYIGDNFNEDEMWKPVNLVDASVKLSSQKQLFDYEISFTMSDSVSQTL